MATTILRGTTLETLTVTNAGTATSPGFSMAGAAGVIVFVKQVSGGASSLTFRVKTDPASSELFTFIPDNVTNPVSQPIANDTAFELPAGLFAARYVIPVTNAGTAEIRVVLKT